MPSPNPNSFCVFLPPFPTSGYLTKMETLLLEVFGGFSFILLSFEPWKLHFGSFFFFVISSLKYLFLINSCCCCHCGFHFWPFQVWCVQVYKFELLARVVVWLFVVGFGFWLSVQAISHSASP